MSAFVTAARALNLDPNLSVAVVYRPLGQGPGTAIRAVRSVPDDLKQVFGANIRVGSLALSVLLSDVAQPRQSDTFTFDDGRIATALDYALDAEGVTWTVQCRG